MWPASEGHAVIEKTVRVQQGDRALPAAVGYSVTARLPSCGGVEAVADGWI